MQNQAILKPLTILAVMLCVIGGISAIVDDSEAADPVYLTYKDSPSYTDQGSQSNPITDLSYVIDCDSFTGEEYKLGLTLYDLIKFDEFYVLVGTSIDLSVYSLGTTTTERPYGVRDVTSGFGLSLSGDYAPNPITDCRGLSGTISKAGTITITIASGFTYNPGSVTEYTVVMHAVATSTPVTSVTISGSSTLNKEVGDTGTLRATVSPSDATDKTLSWKSSDSSVVSISGSGTSITYNCRSEGTATITVTAQDGSNESDSVTINVEDPPTLVTRVTISADSSTVEVGERLTLNVSVTPSDADDKGITWSVSGSNATIVSQTDTRCVIQGVSPGSVTVYADAEDDSGEYDSYSVTVQSPMQDFVLNFNMDGGSPQLSQMNGSDRADTYRFTIPATTPVKNGYDFGGWRASNGSIYQPGQDFYADPGSNTLTAVWNQIQYTCHLNYVATGATSGVPSNDSYTGPETTNHNFTIPSSIPQRPGYTFTEWLGDDGQRYQPGASVPVPYNGTVTLTAQWSENVIDISGEPSTTGLKVGTTWSFTPTVSVDGCTLTVSGADWLIVNGGTITGTPTEAGQYTVTITAQKDNYSSDSMQIVLNVVPELSWTNAPTGGAIIYGI